MMIDESKTRIQFIMQRSSLIIVRVRAYLGLLFLALLTFHPLVLNPTQTLYSDTSDLLAQHIPAKYFLVRSLRETGELPLWNPEQYAGSPFVHDIQVGLFYPPHLPLYFISEPAIGPFVSWLLFAHVLLAGWLMYAYARHAGLSELAAFVAGVGFMLSPRWMMQIFLAGHVVTQGICWLPLVLLGVERAMLRKKWTWAIAGGAAYALLILGTHPQWTFYASLLIGFWPLRLLVRDKTPKPVVADTHKEDYGEPGRVHPAEPEASARAEVAPSLTLRAPPTDEPPRLRPLVLRWLAVEAIVVTVGLALCGVQLIPTYEAAGQSSRAKGMGQSWSLDGARAAATTLIGPIPDRRAESIHWETRGGIGFTWAILAIVGIRLGGRQAVVPAIIAGALLAYALGGSFFIDRLPGFNNFRMPTRILLTLAFPVAFLAALGLQMIDRAPSARLVLWSSFLLVVYLLNGVALEILANQRDGLMWWKSIRGEYLYWGLIFLGSLALLLFSLTNLYSRLKGLDRQCLLFITAAVMAADLLLITQFNCRQYLHDTASTERIYFPSAIVAYIREHNTDGHRAYDPSDLLGPGSPAASIYGVPSVRGYNPLDVARYRQFLAFIADEGEAQQAFAGGFSHPVVLSFQIINRGLFDHLGARYLLTTPDDPCQDDSSWERIANPEFDTVVAPSYSFLGGGFHEFQRSQYILLENRDVAPRSFVVSEFNSQATALPDVLRQLRTMDLRRQALVEPANAALPKLPTSIHPPGPAKIRSHAPNEVRIDLDGKTAGLLVLTDPWYPGWVCRVDGTEVPIWKADYAFRGVMVPEGSREVVFHFEPQSYKWGKRISLTALAFMAIVALLQLASFRKRCNATIA